jgi:2-hydroxychromene-2-carboxylate isomerase
MSNTIEFPGSSRRGAHTFEFWFDYSCPYAYLASTQVRGIAQRTSSVLIYRPMLLGGVFTANQTPQNLSEVLAPAKKRHNELDMMRWAERWGVPLHKPAGHPLRTVDALRATLAAGIEPNVIDAFYRAYWVEGRDIGNIETVRAVLAETGHADAFSRLDAHKEELRVRTDRAIELGIFGAPTFLVNNELFWGQDRLRFVERALGGKPKSGVLHAPSKKHTLDAYFDFSSPFSYLGLSQVEGIATRTGAKLTVRPMLLGALFKTLGTADAPMMTWSQAKQRYYFQDMERWARHWGLPFRWPSRFPMNTVKALRVYLALPEERRKAFRDATYRAYWAEDRDISSDQELIALIGEGGPQILARTQDQDVKDALFAATRTAFDAGVFGAPTFVVDNEHVFWGQDRLSLVEAKLRE